METVRAQWVDERSRLDYAREGFREWIADSLVFYPLLFMVGAILLVVFAGSADDYLVQQENINEWWQASTSIGVTISSLVTSSMLSFLAIVFSISLVALQLANQQYSPRVITIFERSLTTKIALSLFIGTFVYSFILLIFTLRSRLEHVTIVSFLIEVILVFASLIIFIVFMKHVMLMIRVTHTISLIAEETRQAIEDTLPPEKAYIECQIEAFGKPDQMIQYKKPRRSLFSKSYTHGVLKGIERSTLLQIAGEHNCVIQIFPRSGQYLNEGDPVVEIYGECDLNEKKVLKAFYLGPERTVYQDPAYGLRMLVDIALQALSPAVNAPTTAHQVLTRLTNLLLLISQRPTQTGIYTDDSREVRLIQPVFSWEDYVVICFTEIQYYGKDDPHTRLSLAAAFNYLLERVPDTHKPALEEQKEVLLGSIIEE